MRENDAASTPIRPLETEHRGARVIVIMGVSGSGKTVVGHRLADSLGWTYRDADDLHPPENVARMRAGIPLTDADRGPWLATLGRLVGAAIAADGSGLVLACSALRRDYRNRLHVGDPRVRLVYLTGRTDLIRRRLEARTGHYMPASLLESQLTTLEPPDPDEHPIVIDVSETPEAIVGRILAALDQPEAPGHGRTGRQRRSP